MKSDPRELPHLAFQGGGKVGKGGEESLPHPTHPPVGGGGGGVDRVGVPQVGWEVGKQKETAMAKKPNYSRKHDRLTQPGATPAQVQCDMLLAPFDNAAREMDLKWGIDVLPTLVSVELAERWGKAVAGLNEAIGNNEPEKVKAWVEICLRGIKLMDEAAEAANAQRASMDVWEIEYDGIKYGICKDILSWQAIQQQRPDLTLVSLREVAVALASYGQAVVKVKQAFPGAQVKAVKPASDFDIDFGDTIPQL